MQTQHKLRTCDLPRSPDAEAVLVPPLEMAHRRFLSAAGRIAEYCGENVGDLVESGVLQQAGNAAIARDLTFRTPLPARVPDTIRAVYQSPVWAIALGFMVWGEVPTWRCSAASAPPAYLLRRETARG